MSCPSVSASSFMAACRPGSLNAAPRSSSSCERMSADIDCQSDRMAAMRSLWQSMSADMRSQLEELLGAAFNDPGLQAAMNELAETLGQLMPMEGYEHAMSGDEPLTLAEALGLMDEMNQLS